MQKNSIRLLIIFAVFILFISCFNSVQAYGIWYYTKAAETAFTQAQVGTGDLYYRTFETPDGSLIKRFKQWGYGDDDWAYTSNETVKKYLVLYKNSSSGPWILPGGGAEVGNTYRQWSTIIHPNVNTDYQPGTNYKYKTYVSDSAGIIDNTIVEKNREDYETNIIGETPGYKGVYDAPFANGNTGSIMDGYDADAGLYSVSGRKGGVYEILNDAESLRKMQVKSETNPKVVISDRVITKAHLDELVKMFPNQINDGKPLYVSDINYSARSSNINTRYLDTAYKFIKRKPKLVSSYAENSILNVYDNYIVFPKRGTTKVYVRYIDVTGVDRVTAEIASDKAWYVKSINKVGYSLSHDQNKKVYSNSDGYSSNEEFFTFTTDDFVDDEDYITIYNKLYNDETKTSMGKDLTDSTDYSQYDLVGTVVGIGDDLNTATLNRTEKYNDFENIQPRTTVDILKYSHGKYVVIDFLYAKKPKAQVYVRHIDVSGDTSITAADADNYATSRQNNIKRVNFAKANNVNNISPTTSSVNSELFEIDSSQIQGTNYVRIFNKLYDNTTKRSMGESKNKYNSYKLRGTVVGIGDDQDSAVSNRTQEYSLALRSRNEVDITKDAAGKYIVIDFLYSTQTPQPVPTQLLVRHINVTGIDKVTSYNQIDNIVNNGTLSVNIFDGYNVLTRSSGNINSSQLGKFTYPASRANIYYNERYELNDNNTYTLHNEFYDDTNSDYEYLGYTIAHSKYSLIEAEDKRNSKINSINFDNTGTLDGRSEVSIARGDNQYIVVDMYYADTAVTKIENPTVRGRLEFNSVSGTFTNTTGGNYDYIPSSESMYASITGASKFMLGGIRVVPKVIEATQEIHITVNVPYTYTYSYWAKSACSTHSSNTGTHNSSCDESIIVDYEEVCTGSGENVTCTDVPVYGPHEAPRTERVSETGSGSGTITKSFVYKIPYKYDYYKISNIRTYKITSMDLFDSENDTDLPLFGGTKYNIPVSSSYKTSVKGSFTQSTSSQTLTDGRSIDSITISTNKDEVGSNLTEIVTTANVAFPNQDYDTPDTTAEQAQTAITSYLNPLLTKIQDDLTHTSAPILTSVSNDGTVNKGNSSNGTKVTFKVTNDRISAGNVNILVDDSVDTRTTTIELTDDYAYIDETTAITGEKQELKTEYPDNIYKQYGYSDTVSNPTIESDFEAKSLTIPLSRLNGERISKAKVYYEVVQDENTSSPTLNFDVSVTEQSKPHAWTRLSKTTSGDTFNDTEMNEDVETRIIPGSNLKSKITYDYISNKTNTNHGSGDIVNVFTPIKYNAVLKNVQASGGQLMDHTTSGISNDMQIIQKDTRFEVTIAPQGSHNTYTQVTANKMNEYIKEYYIKFDNLEIEQIRYIDESGTEISYNGGASIPSNVWIGPIPNRGASTYISAITRDDPNLAGGIFNEEANTYTVRGITKNATITMLEHFGNNHGTIYPEDLIDRSTSSTTESIARGGWRSSDTLRHGDYYYKKQLYNDSNYAAQTTSVITYNLGRIYDFKITDVKDLDWKNTFRKSSSSNTNVHSGVVYYSGNRKLNIYTTNFNEMIRRNADEVGTGSERTLPVGPYKNTNSSYTYAPKLGYRFSFDFKTTGKVTSSGKTAKIKPSFMFISKEDGKITENIDLYYKNSSGKYVKVGSSSDNMNLYFVPNDGYRLTFTEQTYNFNTSNLSSKTVKLGTLTELNLDKRMMATSDNQFAQIWYGEYKLPNSTIAVPEGETNLSSKRLTNGYIAVKFNIEVKDRLYTIAYGQNNRNNSGEIKNTSQWDYEGYLGYSGSGYSGMRLRLDRGKTIDINTIDSTFGDAHGTYYSKLKGTVILYDADARADSDYN